MIINVSGISQGTTHLAERIDRRELGFESPGARLVSHVELSVKAVRMGDEVYIEADAAAELELDCSRCLEPYVWPFKGRLQELFAPAGTELSRGRDEDTCRFYRENVIDLADDVRELLAAELPRKPLCTEDCPGICPYCGRSRRSDPCSCTPPDTSYHPFKDLKFD